MRWRKFIFNTVVTFSFRGKYRICLLKTKTFQKEQSIYAIRDKPSKYTQTTTTTTTTTTKTRTMVSFGRSDDKRNSKKNHMLMLANRFVLMSSIALLLTATMSLRSYSQISKQSMIGEQSLNSMMSLESFTTTSCNQQISRNISKSTKNQHHHLGVASFVSGDSHVHGAFSIHNQLAKFDMKQVTQVAVVPDDIEPKVRSSLISFLGEENVRSVHTEYVKDRLTKDQWRGTFNKLFLFNLTQFDKVIMLDNDILIRTNLMHWYDYPAPCGIQGKDDIAWNSGAMVIEPNQGLFDEMIDALPNVYSWQKSKHTKKDNLSTGYTDQDFLTAFFTSHHKRQPRRCVMPTESAVLSSSLDEEKFEYFTKHRASAFESVHFTAHKPTKRKTKPNHPFICAMLKEWKKSIQGIEKHNIPPLRTNYLEKCPRRKKGLQSRPRDKKKS